MPPRNAGEILRDIIIEAGFAGSWASAQTVESFGGDPVLKRAVVRCLETIGEAIRQLGDSRPDLTSQLTGAAAAVRVRNFIAHRYYEVDDGLVLMIVRDHVPRLLDEAIALFEQERPV